MGWLLAGIIIALCGVKARSMYQIGRSMARVDADNWTWHNGERR